MTDPLTLPAVLVAQTAERHGSREALVDGETRLTWSDVDALRRSAAAAWVFGSAASFGERNENFPIQQLLRMEGGIRGE